ncbi:MAG: hypothetical protein FWD22_00785 [Treponema sp.]|nr:hypothetical protein [Treponema sp.]
MRKILAVSLLIIFLAGCANTPKKSDQSNNINIKYPVVLVHGIFAHDRRSIIDFWGRIPKVLKDPGINVYYGNTDAWGSYETNAEILKSTIDNILLETKSEKVNIIAHSKGGIDSRYLIWKYDYGDKVASLTTVSTPHHGSELADLIFSKKIVHSKMGKNIMRVIGELWGDTNPDIYNVNYQLTTEKMSEFNELVKMDPNVFYQSIYSTMRNAFDDLMFFNSFLQIKRRSGVNDGVVSEVSSIWSGNITKFTGISHAEIVDSKKRKISGIDVPEIYLYFIRDLSNRGF